MLYVFRTFYEPLLSKQLKISDALIRSRDVALQYIEKTVPFIRAPSRCQVLLDLGISIFNVLSS
ncbi:MAG: hypothetical protein DRP96_07020 [Candidatus Neomarinimicrobiota bacterium]|nr:MAG: hypothetical protein DRP96_07020 [Candidatus Neomarinimicrobiota bacterium]